MRKNIQFILLLVILCILLGVYFYFKTNQTKNNLSQIENWSLYQEINKQSLGYDIFGDPNECVQVEGFNQEFVDFKNKANEGSVKQFLYNEALTLTITPNYNNWSNEKFLAFAADNGAFCSAGGLVPLHAYADKLLWSAGCGGVMNAESTKCTEAEQATLDYFSKIEFDKNIVLY